MKASFQFSVYNVFHEKPFFSQMPPRLQDKLFKIVMVREYKTLAYFFHDKMYKQKAERGLIRKIVTALHCSFYEDGVFI
jgi:hypothetical protein